MFGGKTTELQNRVRELQETKRVLVLSHASDTRYGVSKIISHDKVEIPCIAVEELHMSLVAGYDVVALDEGQFFTGLRAFVEECKAREIHVIVAGLDLDLAGEPFGEMLEVAYLPGAVVRHHTAECAVCGGDAYFSECLTGEGGVGGADKYEARCGEHFSGKTDMAYKAHLLAPL